MVAVSYAGVSSEEVVEVVVLLLVTAVDDTLRQCLRSPRFPRDVHNVRLLLHPDLLYQFQHLLCSRHLFPALSLHVYSYKPAVYEQATNVCRFPTAPSLLLTTSRMFCSSWKFPFSTIRSVSSM